MGKVVFPPLSLYESRASSPGDGAGAVLQSEPLECSRQMRLHGLLGDRQPLADGAVREAFSDEQHHLALAPAQLRPDPFAARRENDRCDPWIER